MSFPLRLSASTIVNPFSANSSYYSGAMFFSTLLPNKTTSRLCDMDLIAIVNSMDLKNENGVDKVLEAIVEELFLSLKQLV